MFRLVFIGCILFINASTLAQKKIFYYKSAQGVIFNDTSQNIYNENQKKVIIRSFEDSFQKKYPEFHSFVRQYDIDFFKNRSFLYVRLIPMEKSYQYRWRYEQYIGRCNDVRLVSFDIDHKILSDVSRIRVNE